MTSYNRKRKKQQAKRARREWRTKIGQRIAEFRQRPSWWQKIGALDSFYRSLSRKKKKLDN